jgi:hypothetical protein
MLFEDEEKLLREKIELYQIDINNKNQEIKDLKFLVGFLLEEIKELYKEKDQLYYNKDDIMRMFNCKEQKARMILKYAMQLGLATQVNNSWIISYENFKIFIEEYYGGNKINITF